MKTTSSRPKQRSHALTVAYASGAMFAILMALLVIRLEAGLDPSIGTSAYKLPAVQQRKLVIHRRIVKVIHDKPLVSSGAGGSGYSAPQGTGGGSYSAPAPAPQTSTPAPAPAPAPAPTTKAS